MLHLVISWEIMPNSSKIKNEGHHRQNSNNNNNRHKGATEFYQLVGMIYIFGHVISKIPRTDSHHNMPTLRYFTMVVSQKCDAKPLRMQL